MANQQSKTARVVAALVLNQFDPKRNYASPILNKLLNETDEKQRATDLVFGTLRNRNAIDTVITIFSTRPVERIPSNLLNVIRIAVFELIYSPATPIYSIVNEAVKNTKTIGGKKQTGFVNAVLRQITRHIKNRQSQLSEADPQSTIAQTPKIGCEFDRCFLPDPKTSPADYLSTAFSLPKWLVTDWLGEFGAEYTRQICLASNRRPSIYLRPNRLKTTAQELAEKLCQTGINAEIVPEMEMIRLRSPQAVTELPGFAEGWFTVQDITSSQAVWLLQPQPDWTILDLCAAPGVKTTQLADVTNDSARIIATDIDSQRLKMVKENTTRLGISSVSIILYEQLEQKAAEVGLFDAVLLDVPCSNTGVLAKRIETRYRLNPKAIEQLTKTQMELLHKAVRLGGMKPGGKICYSTCSIQKAENGRLVREFLQKHRDFMLESEQLILPSAESRTNCSSSRDCPYRGQYFHYLDSIGAADHDGSYVAIIAKT